MDKNLFIALFSLYIYKPIEANITFKINKLYTKIKKMLSKSFILHALGLSLLLFSCSSAKKTTDSSQKNPPSTSNTSSYLPEGAVVEIITSMGNMKILLYNETPLHRDNFIKMAESAYLDSTLFHRVINGFMIQGGDPDSKAAKQGQFLGNGGPGYTIPAEFVSKYFHKKGVLAAAREGDQVNPKKASSGSQFYIVQGKKLSDNDLKNFEYRINRDLLSKINLQIINKPENAIMKSNIEKFQREGKNDSLMALGKKLDAMVFEEYNNTPHYTFTPEQINAYKTIGGTPHLDGAYTVFGEVIEGLEVIDKIAASATDKNDRPYNDIRMAVKVIKKK
jgi:cyclophilin family peptidyl-prolyl cis-trans isomerase